MHFLKLSPLRAKVLQHIVDALHRLVVLPKELSTGVQRCHSSFRVVDWGRLRAGGRLFSVFGVLRRGSRLFRLVCEPSVPIDALFTR